MPGLRAMIFIADTESTGQKKRTKFIRQGRAITFARRAKRTGRGGLRAKFSRAGTMTRERITIPMRTEDKKLLLEALQIGLETCQEEAAEYHRTMAGYRQYRHDAMDADIETIKRAISFVEYLSEDVL